MLVSFTLAWHKLESFRQGEPQLRKCLHQIGLWAACWAFPWGLPWLVWKGSTHCGQCCSWAGCSASYTRKKSELARRNKPVTTTTPLPHRLSHPPWLLLQFLLLGSFLEFLLWLPLMQYGSGGEINPFLPKVPLDHGVYYSNKPWLRCLVIFGRKIQ